MKPKSMSPMNPQDAQKAAARLLDNLLGNPERLSKELSGLSLTVTKESPESDPESEDSPKVPCKGDCSKCPMAEE